MFFMFYFYIFSVQHLTWKSTCSTARNASSKRKLK